MLVSLANQPHSHTANRAVATPVCIANTTQYFYGYWFSQGLA